MWFLKNGDEIIGNFSLHQINKMMLTAEIGSPHARGNGIANFALRQLTQLCFENTSLRKFIAYVHESITASRKVLERIGYKNEGFLQEHFLIDGRPANEVIYGILSHQWKSSQAC